VLDDEPACRHPLQALGHDLAQLAHTPATARASGGGWIDHPRARQVLGKRTPGRLATGKAAYFGRLAGIGRLGRLRLSRGLLQVLQRELELLQPSAALSGGAEPLAPEPGNLQLQAFDLDVENTAGDLRGLCLSFSGDPGRPLSQDHRLGTGEV
jgi:hypothetical protein